MPRLTNMQKLAVDKEKTNIIVSAGAGSGKTTVLKTRVERKLLDGVNINDLIILTFTNAAASEMKDRIRKVIKNNKDIAYMEEYIDSSYITTFDAFAQSMVKKYAYLLNMSDNFSIIDANIVNIEIDKIIDDIFEELYQENNPHFIKLISEQTTKNDKQIRNSIKNVYRKLQNMIDKDTYLNTYIDHFYSDEFITNTFNIFEEYVFSIKDDILDNLDNLEEYSKSETIEQNEIATSLFKNASSYDEILETIDFKLVVNRGNNYTEGVNIILEKITDLKKKIKNLKTNGDKKMLINNYLLTKDYAKIIIKILKKLDTKLNEYKNKHNAYEFIDISLKSIELVKNNPEVRDEIKYKTKEIMIDEYQDTNDIQEEFISLIANNNVYMVGDIKQSIYRFRNANPYIFKSKYEQYKENINGFKIDLMENFRSRNTVVSIINLIFESIMTDKYGGCNYKDGHVMIYGNKSYDNFDKHYYNLEILNYNLKNRFNKVENEAFIIADDIKKRIQNKEQVTYYKDDTMCTRDITFKDFTILIDKSTEFENIKKILEAQNIPTSIKRDINITNEDEIHILKNIITLIIKIKKNQFDTEFKHAFTSIARSYLFAYKDDEIYKIIHEKKYQETILYKIAFDISLKIDSLSNKDIILLIIDQFDFYNKLLTVNNITERLLKLEYFTTNASDLNKFGLNIYDLKDYLSNIIDNGLEIKIHVSDTNSNSVNIMTIHTSKGLEFSYVYLPMLTTNFYKKPTQDLFHLSNNFGMTLPFYNDGIGTSFIKFVDDIVENVESLSEKIRLYYVALTRAKEKIILINPYKDIDVQLNNQNILKFKSFSDIINGMNTKLSPYRKMIDVENLDVNFNYNDIKTTNYKESIKDEKKIINVKELNIENKESENKHFSKALTSLIDKKLKDKLDFGTFMHYMFEVSDFKNIDSLNIDEALKERILNFLNHDEVKNIKDAKIYKEFEIRFKDNDNTYHGFIDLLLEYPDHFDIIDYKLSNLESDEYKTQLNGYKNYIQNNYHKKTNIYLYSINKDIFKKLD